MKSIYTKTLKVNQLWNNYPVTRNEWLTSFISDKNNVYHTPSKFVNDTYNMVFRNMISDKIYEKFKL